MYTTQGYGQNIFVGACPCDIDVCGMKRGNMQVDECEKAPADDCVRCTLCE